MAKGKYEEWLTDEGLIKLEGWARDGLTDEQIAHNMGIHVSTLYDWKNKYCEISDTLKRGKEVIDRMVENALLKRALGYEFEEKTFETQVFVKKSTDEDGNVTETPYTKEVLSKRVIKQVAPDTTAQIFWLKNRKPNEWRDKHEQNISFNPAEMTDEQIDQMVKAYATKTE